MTEIINEIETDPIKEFKIQVKKDKRDELLKLKTISEDINKIKDFLLFKKIFEKSQGNNQEDRYNYAKDKLDKIKNLFTKEPSTSEKSENKKQPLTEEPLSNIEEIILVKYKDIFNEIKEELSKKEDSVSDGFIKQMIKICNIQNDKTKKDLNILIKSKKYEIVVKSIKFFFENFGSKKLILPKNIELSKMNLKQLNTNLKVLKGSNIFDYSTDSYFYKVFTSFYEKKEAIDFLISKIDTNIANLKDKLDPTVKSISIKDIEDSIQCLNHFTLLIKKEDALEIINYIKYLDETHIDKFVSYSKHYPSIIELDRKNEKDIFEEVYTIVEDAKLIFNLDNEYFYYNINDQTFQKDINKLIDLKNKINIQHENSKKKKDEKNEEGKKCDLYHEKCDKLIFFKEIVSNFEAIYDKIKILRKKGYNIPIKIYISIKYPEISYKFNEEGEEKDFKDIKKYLFTIKNDYEEQLDTIYQNEKHLRFLYGKLFRKIKLHQEGNRPVSEILRYILNKVDYEDKIIDGEPYNVKSGDDFESEFKFYTKNIFKFMSKYIISLFEKNNLSYQKHYENMLIKGEKKYKGIYIYKSRNLSMEQLILFIFKNKLEKLPIAQNILICSNETSIEEMQSFFYRAILCDYNTLFIIEVLESFSNFQHNKMYSYIDKLLSYKLENCENKKLNKYDTKDYLNSCIYFVYKNLDNEYAFRNELDKYSIQRQNKDNFEKILVEENDNLGNGDAMGDLNISNILNNSSKIQTENIKVFSSDVCGLGKTFQIKKLIKQNNDIYYHFPLGGRLTKKTIYEKILKLLKKIKKDNKIRKDEENKINKNDKENKKNQFDKENKKYEEYFDYNNIAVHLDLIETEDTSLINEFLFSFLITKFYNNNEDIIYIPNNIKIYVEIPNSFENYLVKYGILNVFPKEHIKLEELPKLELDKETIKIFKRIIDKKTNEDIEAFIKENIGLAYYSYHQVVTFIKLFISQFILFDEKLKFTNSQGSDVTEECIDYFAKSTKYFTNGGFARLIVNKNKVIKDKIDLCLDAYENDLNKENKENKEKKEKKEIFKTPLIFIDKKTKKCRFEMLPEIADEDFKNIKNVNISNKEVDILYLIDATGSMGDEINAAKTHVVYIFEELKNKYKDYKFRFGAVFYRDQIDSPSDKNEYFQLTDNMDNLKKGISEIKPYGGNDIPEDWVTGYKMALNDIIWGNGIKLIIHIADAGAHGEEYSIGDKYTDEGPKLTKLIQECALKNINIIGFQIGENPKQSFEKMSEIYNLYKLENKDNGQFIEIIDCDRGEDKKKKAEVVSRNFLRFVIEAANQVVNPSYKY